MIQFRTPGVYLADVTQDLPVPLKTGVPAMLGYLVGDEPVNVPELLSSWTETPETGGSGEVTGYLSRALNGFFKNGGRECYLVRLDWNAKPVDALRSGLASIDMLEDVDIVCAPDIMMTDSKGAAYFSNRVIQDLQRELLEFCDHGPSGRGMGLRFAILDSLPNATDSQVQDQRNGLEGRNGALYYPWIGAIVDQGGAVEMVPPCGHLAGIYARTDDEYGYFTAPANKVLSDAVDLQVNLSNARQSPLNNASINCLRSFPGRGVLVWGARCLSDSVKGEFINQRRLMITFARWLLLSMSSYAFEPNEPKLWASITRDISAHLDSLFLRGALAGSRPEQAYFVRCDAQTNPPAVRASGQVVAEVGLAPAFPAEFIIVKIIHDSGGTFLTRLPSDAN